MGLAEVVRRKPPEGSAISSRLEGVTVYESPSRGLVKNGFAFVRQSHALMTTMKQRKDRSKVEEEMNEYQTLSEHKKAETRGKGEGTQNGTRQALT